jgi:F-type H+-transporting ATPase subunit b
MRLLAILAAEGSDPIDDARSIHWLWPAQAELIYGTLASVIIFTAIFKFAGPAVKKAMADRTQAIQDNLDAAEQAQNSATGEAADIREAAGDIDAERQRLFADADAQAEAVLSEGRSRLDHEVAELEARADADITAASGRVNDELRGEITKLANAATEQLLADGAVDSGTQQDLIESFISRVGAS